MNNPMPPPRQDLVLVGGGHSHVTVLKRLGMDPLPGVRITVICRDAHAPYSGMLPGLVAGTYEFDDAHIDLGPLCRFGGARFLHDEVVGLDRQRRRVLCRNRPPVAYDLLSINIGSRPAMAHVAGATETVIPVKPIDGFARRWERLRERVLAREEETVLAFVGGGAGGVELLMAVQHRLRHELSARGRTDEHLRYRLYAASAEILATHNRGVRRRFARILQHRGVEVFADHEVLEVARDARVRLSFANRPAATVDEILWVTTAAAQEWPAEAGLEVDEAGFIKVADTLQSIGDPRVFAAGDAAAVVNHPRPKAGVFAVRQGAPLERNLRRVLCSEAPVPFRPQREFLSLISTGDRYAVASRGRWSLEGRWVWHWKDRINRAFMRKYNELPAMPEAETSPAAGPAGDPPPGPAMRCAGCGSKIGSGILERALARLDIPTHSEVVQGLDSPDDAAIVEIPAGRVAVQTVDQFRAMIDDPYTFGRVAAVHALGDLWAMGAEPQSAMALVTLPLAGEQMMEEDLVQLLSGALVALRAAGATLVGGHTNEGPELALGFALTGTAEPGALLRKSGLQPGQALVLTKAIGTGALFAAHMRAQAKGRWIERALHSMLIPGDKAAAILRDHGATALTDVTGFGLVGHLAEMLRASKCGANLEVDRVPFLDGAEEVVRGGVVSSLQPQNLRAAEHIANRADFDSDSRYPLLFDPQTAGGMLAGLPADRADAAVESLRRAGLTAVRLGSVTPGDVEIRLI